MTDTVNVFWVKGATSRDEELNAVRDSKLYKRGDTVRVWVNEADLYSNPVIKLETVSLVGAPKAEPVSDPYKLEPMLWSMHILGPDDMYPAPDLATAFQWCEYVNSELAPRTPDVLCAAVPAIWDGSAEAHAKGLQDAINGWAVPAQPEAPKVEQEPVAWLITNKASGVKDLSFRKLADFPFNHSRFEAEPLYAHHAPFSGEMYEALVDLASWFTQPLQGLDGQVWAIPAGERGADEALEVARSLIVKHKGPQS